MSSFQSRIAAFTTKHPYWWLYAVGFTILLASSWLWWTKVYLSPSRVFWGMLDKSLSTSSVTVRTEQESGGSTIAQVVQYQLGSANRAHSITNLTQGNTKVQTEIIGTPDADYTRYRSISTDQKNADGKKLDVSKVVNVWAKSDNTPQTETEASGRQLFAQATLGIGLPIGSVPVPVGQLSPEERQKLVGQIKDQQVYETSFKDIQKTTKDGRLLYTYKTTIQTILYVRMMKTYAQHLGLHELDKVDPNTYQSAQPMQVSLVVDARSRQLVAIERPNTSYRQTYSAYGVPVKVSLPKQTISTTELHQRLSAL